tara:strand:- start:38591 stop:39262 length:672 start_codon:yes stop_codon:yes gene_type:complete
MKWNIKSILDKFRDRSDQPASDSAPSEPIDSQAPAGNLSVIDTMDMPDLIDAMALRGDKIRAAIGISDEEPESTAWRDVAGTGHLYIRGALQSLERISKNEHDAEAAGTAEGTINFAAKSPDGFFGSTAAQSAKVAQKILAAEKDGITDISQIVTKTDIDALMIGMKDADDMISFMASEEGAANDIKQYAHAFTKTSEHYKAFGAYMEQRLDTGMKNTPHDFS